ncbi:MAG: DUF2934 domain-containing protein [Trueperaceae bacterium]|nr:DUF2934 domain-containing protein [Trueperaceae bacterium]
MSDTNATPRRPRTKKTAASAPSADTSAEAPAGVAPGGDTSAEAGSEVPHEHVAERAYHKFLARGREHGRDADDWTEAERELRSERSASTKRRSKTRR